MTFGQTVPFRKRLTSYTADDRVGASVAHAELLSAVLQYSSVHEVRIYDSQAAETGEANSAIAELQGRYPQKRVRSHPVHDLLSKHLPQDLVMYHSGISSAPLAQARETAKGSYPICSIAHSLDISPLVCMAWTLPLARSCDAILVSSAAGRVALLELIESGRAVASQAGGYMGPFQPEICSIPLGVDSEFLAPMDRGLCRHCLQIDKDDIVLLYMGRLTAQHKADLWPLLLAVRELLKEFPRLTLLLAGSDSNLEPGYARKVETDAADLGILPQLRIIRNFPPFVKPIIYGAADVFVSPADNVQETFGMALAEAMACGLPVVASDWSGYRDIVVHNETGFLIPTFWNSAAAEAVSRLAPLWEHARYALSEQTVVDVPEMVHALRLLVGNTSLRSEFGRAGRARVESVFSWRPVIARHEDLWTELLAKSRTVSRPSLPVDNNGLNRTFSHYATRSISGSMFVEAGVELDNWRPAVYSERILRSAMTSPETVLEACRNRPVSVDELTARFGGDVVYLVGWMLKQGYMRSTREAPESSLEEHLEGELQLTGRPQTQGAA